MNNRARFHIIILLLFIQAMWEMTAVSYRKEWCKACDPDSMYYFLLFHTGNTNNSAWSFIVLLAVGYVFCKIANIPLPSTTIIRGIWAAAALVSLLFIIIEWHDPRDIPFALVGIGMVLWACLPKKGYCPWNSKDGFF